MKKYGQKVLAVLLCVCVVFSCMAVQVSAASSDEVIEFIKNILDLTGALDKFAQALEYNSADEILSNVFQDVTGRTQRYNIVRPSKLATSFSQVLKVNLNSIAQDWNTNYSHYDDISWVVRTATTRINGEDCWVIAVSVPKSAFVLSSGYDTWYLCDGFGNVLYATKDDSVSSSNSWRPIKSLGDKYYLVSYESLYNLAVKENGTVRKFGDYYIITGPLGTNALCNPDGLPYAAIANKDSSAINQDRPTSTGSVVENNTTNNYISNEYIDEGDTFYTYDTTNNTYNTTNETYETIINNIEEGDTYYIKEGDTYYEIVIDNSQHIDIENMTQVLPGGVLNQIDSVIYDENNKTYYVDSHDLSLTQNYYYTYQYHINYTSITYIGQTEEYEKNYELYYQLPDGRDSADLTAADLEQLSTSFKDVMNYARSADDLSQRALYHFDGNTEDSSYWSYCSSFDWAKGASLTYMDEGTFGGSLYLDETEHDFTLTLPGTSDASGDFTLQFRYYQSYTAVPQTDSYITIGGVKVLQFDGAKYYNGSGTAIASTSIGSWNELCLMRKDGVLYYYINGVPYGSMSVSIASSVIRFYFGSSQQTYKKLDELRFTRGAIYEPGQNYTPTSVPYDSNLSLVLPDGKIPLADEVMVVNKSKNNLLDSVGLSDWTDPNVVNRLFGHKTPYYGQSDDYFPEWADGITLAYDTDIISFSPSSGCLVDFGGTTVSTTRETDDFTCVLPKNVLFLPFGDLSYGGFKYKTFYDSGLFWGDFDKKYTFSIVLSDGSYSTVTFHAVENGSMAGTVVIDSYDNSSCLTIGGYLFGQNSSSDYRQQRGIYIKSTTGTANILYMELVEGDSFEFSISYEGAVYDPSELTESPILAVRSNTPISTYQIGGVRPSYPQKGQVYAMVENGYITSLQQYTGYAWESVDGRIWTGSRWIPASSYNVITLQDMYDIVDATPDYEYIYTESGFWDWFQRAWKDLIARLDKIIDGMGSGSSGGSLDPEDDTMLPSVEDDPETEGDEGWGAFDLLIVIKDGTWSLITGVISTGFNGLVGLAQGFSHVTGFFNAYDGDSSANVLGITNYGGSDIWD